MEIGIKMNLQIKLAKEVLNLIDLEQILIKKNVYLTISGEDFLDTTNSFYIKHFDFVPNGNVPYLLKFIKEQNKICEVCAIGSMFLAACNGYPIPRRWNDMMNLLKDYFDIKSLALIEIAFEGQLNGIITEEPFEEEFDHCDDEGDSIYNYIVESHSDMNIFNEEDRKSVV